MASVNVYLPDNMKAEMDAAGDAINWSMVARVAFRSALADLNHRRIGNMGSAIERLRASKESYRQQLAQDGKGRGRKWATDYADYQQLVAVAELGDGASYAALTNALPEDEVHDALSDDKRELEAMSEDDLDAFCEAFVEGAAEVYDEVKDQL